MERKKKVFLVAGARPNFVKIAPLWKAMAGRPGLIIPEIVHTGQHYDYAMSEIFFRELDLPAPSYSLGAGSASHAKQTAVIMTRFEDVCISDPPGMVVVFGDVNSTLACSLVSSKLGIPVAHVESGLRSYNRSMPEEINRVVTDHLSSFLFCPTEKSVKNLEREGFESIVEGGRLLENLPDITVPSGLADNRMVFNTGDIMYDMMLQALEKSSSSSSVLSGLSVEPGSYNLLTIHRAENTGDLRVLSERLKFARDNGSGCPVVFPVHPRTRKILENVPGNLLEKMILSEPVGYFDMVWLIKNANMVFTDSGGVQKEAYWAGTPCVTLREETEWPETVESGRNVLYKNYGGRHIFRQVNALAYGDGRSACRMAGIIERALSTNG